MNNNSATPMKLEPMRLGGMARAFRTTMETGVTHSLTGKPSGRHRMGPTDTTGRSHGL